MEILLVAPTLLFPVCVICWRHDLGGHSRTLIQGFLVVFGATLTTGGYLALKLTFGREPDTVEKFWVALPLFTSMLVTGRCIFSRLVRLAIRSRRPARHAATSGAPVHCRGLHVTETSSSTRDAPVPAEA